MAGQRGPGMGGGVLNRTPLRNQSSPECHFFNVHPARGHAEGEGINTEGCKMQCFRLPAWEGRRMPVDLGFFHLQTGARHTLSQRGSEKASLSPKKTEVPEFPRPQAGMSIPVR